jgi:hypothetical protein
MYTTLHEPISVVGFYTRGKFFPKKFIWREKSYNITQQTFSTDLKDGGRKQRMYSVVAENNTYRLTFDRDLEEWSLEEVWVE